MSTPWANEMNQQLFQIVLAGPASKSLIVPTELDIARAGSSEQMRDLHQNDQQDETRPMVLKISQKTNFNCYCHS